MLCGPRALWGGFSKVVTVFQWIKKISSQIFCFLLRATLSRTSSHYTQLHVTTPICPSAAAKRRPVSFLPGHYWVEVLHVPGPRSYLCISLLSRARAWGGLRNEKRGKRRDKEGEREQSRADAIKRLGHRSQCQASVWLIHHHSAQELFLHSVWMWMCVCVCVCVCVWFFVCESPIIVLQLGGTSASQHVLPSGEPGLSVFLFFLKLCQEFRWPEQTGLRTRSVCLSSLS